MPEPTVSLDELAALSAEPFESRPDAPVTLMDGEGASVALTLRAVRRNPGGTPPRALREAFSLILEDEPGREINAGAFFLHHPAVGTLPPVVVNPIMDTDGDAAGRLYQVVFA